MVKEREALKNKKRIVIKIGSSSLTHPETGDLNMRKIEKLVRIISDLRGEGWCTRSCLPNIIRRRLRFL